MGYLITAIIFYLLYRLGKKAEKPSSRPSPPPNTNKTSSFSVTEQKVIIPLSSGKRLSGGGKWIAQHEQHKFKGRTITGGLFFCGANMPSADGYGTEPSFLNGALKCSKPEDISDPNTPIYSDETLGYWPSWSDLSPRCRGIYVDWLASDRNHPSMPIGYVFVYFYGLERRIWDGYEAVESNAKVSDEEFRIIFEEVLRLYHVYHSNRSFRNYAANFLEAMYLLRSDLLANYQQKIPTTQNAFIFKFNLARKVATEQPVDAATALNWLKNTFAYTLRTPARRCPSEFTQLFTLRFEQKFAQGIKVKANKTKLQLHYQPASGGISQCNIQIEDLPDPTVLSGPINKITPIADQCTEELNAYSRYLGKADTAPTDIAALLLLPDELANESNSTLLASFKQWAEQTIRDHNGLTTFSGFWSYTGMSEPAAVNKKEMQVITNLAAKANMGIAPDPRFHRAKLKPDSHLVLFSPGHGEYFEATEEFERVSLTLRLGSMVAAIDGHIDEAEKALLQNQIDHNSHLSPTAKASLHAYLTWRLNTPANATGLKARIAALSEPHIEAIKRVIIAIALADGSVDTSEVKQIEKLYTALGLDKHTVSSDIHQFRAESTALHNTSSTATEETSQPSSEGQFALNPTKLHTLEQATRDAQNMLENIFEFEEIPENPQPEPLTNQQQAEQDSPYAGLDRSHSTLLSRLLEQEKWLRDDIQSLCEPLELMMDGALETINDWAFEQVDAPVIDDDGDIYIDMDIVQELQLTVQT